MNEDRTKFILFVAILALSIFGIRLLFQYKSDYGSCLSYHEEPRHRDAWVEMRQITCGRDCTTTIPIYHPAEDWTVIVCDEYQYPDGCGPNVGSKRRIKCGNEDLEKGE